MPRLESRYFLRYRDGSRVALQATNAAKAIEEALAVFGAAIEFEIRPPIGEQRWQERLDAILADTPAQRWQAEALATIRGIGDLTCHRLALLAGKATFENVVVHLRGKSRARAADVVGILNALHLGKP